MISFLVSYGVNTSKTKDRLEMISEMIRMLDDLKLEDIVVIADITRISRSTKDLLRIV